MPIGGSFLLPLFYLIRLKITFNNSIYDLNNKIMIGFFGSIIISTIFSIFGCFYTIYNKSQIAISYFIISSLISNCILFVISYLFCNKLFWLIFTQRNSNMYDNISDISRKIELIKQSEQLIANITKQSLLIIIATIMFLFHSICYVLFIAFYTHYPNKHNNNNSNVFSTIFEIFMNIIGTIAVIYLSLSLLFSFGFSNNYYCKLCNK